MPIIAAKPCRTPGCGVLVRDGGGYCPAHKRAVRKEVDSRRGSSTRRGYGYKWQQAREGFLRQHPLCQCDDCQEGKIRLRKADVVDHIVAHKLDGALDSGDANQIARARELFWNRDNWRAMAKDCHDRKTAREDGAFGNARRTTDEALKGGGGQISTPFHL